MMISIFREIKMMRNEGKLHARLLTRIQLLFLLCVALAGILAYNLFTRGFDAGIIIALALIGFSLGLFILSRMNEVRWNEEKEVMDTERMDMVGLGALVLYIAFEIGLRTFLQDLSPSSATVLLLAAVLGALAGRAAGTLIEIHRVYRMAHNLDKPASIFDKE